MIEQEFESPEHWERWLLLTRTWPERHAELRAKVLLIHRGLRHSDQCGDPLLRAMERADVAMSIGDEVDATEREHPPRRFRTVAAILAMAACVLFGLWAGTIAVAPPETSQMRGDMAPSSAEAWLVRDGVALGSVSIGRGLRPQVQAGGTVHVEARSDSRVVGWVVGEVEVHDLTEGWTSSPRAGETWVLAVLEPGANAAVVAGLVGRGDTLVPGLSGGEFVFVDWTH